MKRLGVTSSIAAVLGLAAIIASCSEAGSPTQAATTPDDATATVVVPASLSAVPGGGWNPVVEAAANTDQGKVAICHTGDGKHFVQIMVSNQARGHLGDPSTGRGGHAGDYRMSALTECPPPANPGQVKICKVAGAGVTAGTNATFTLTPSTGQARTVTVAAGAAPAGTCTDAGSFPIGSTVQVTEAAQQGVATSAIAVAPTGAQQGTSDLAGRTASVVIGTGATTLTFTNSSTNGTLVICKVAGTGVTTGTNFSFTYGTQTVTVAAGAAPAGTCSAPLTVAAGALTVTETAATGTSVQSIAGTPAAPTNINLAARSAAVQITAGQETRITFTNVAP